VARQAILNGARPRSYVAMCTGAGALPIEQQARPEQLIAALPFFTLAQIHQIVVEGEFGGPQGGTHLQSLSAAPGDDPSMVGRDPNIVDEELHF
jgi:hypothetical protein